MRFRKTKNAIKAVAFVVIFVILFNFVQDALIKRNTIDVQNVPQFYSEREDSLDAVYIGSSNCFTFWNSAAAFEEYGICIYPYSCNSQSFYAAKHIIEEVRKTQPNVPFIININSINDGTVSVDSMHYLLDVMPTSLNKISLIHHLSEVNGYTLSERMEFYLPIIRFHSRTSELTPADFGVKPNGLKGAATHTSYLNRSQNVSKGVVTTDERGELSQKLIDYVNELLDYCDKEDVNILFVTVPQAKDNKKKITQYNTLNDLLKERGYPTLDLSKEFEEIGINPSIDFYDGGHTNIHGSIKYTHYLAAYLVDNYGFTDKRENEDYADWQVSLEKYVDTVDSKILDFELDPNARNYDLKKPSVKVVAGGNNVKISWSKVDGADGYAVYRKEGYGGTWEQITLAKEYTFKDTDVKKKTDYYYTVVAYTEQDGQRQYGDYTYNGIKVAN